MKILVIIVKDKNKKETAYGYEYESEEIKSLLTTYYKNPIFSEILVKIDKPNSSLYIGKGKAEEIRNKIKTENCAMAVINITLTQRQQRNLSEIFEAEVIDKTFLILEIFRQRARSEEGKLQVELARLKYELSKITGHGVSLDQQYGAVGVRGGAGERKIDYDRRFLRDRISFLNSKILSVKKTREIQRKKRLNVPMPVISIVGYTNAGKSTLLNSLSKKNDIYADNKLFATLDPTSRKVMIKKGFFAVFTDTVGFINNLPHLLISAFSATLEEIKYSDLIIHLHDSTAEIEEQNMVVKKTLKEIGADKIPLLNVFNKIDLVPDTNRIKSAFQNLEPIFISAKEKIGLDNLLSEIDKKLSLKWKEVELELKDFKNINEIKKNYFIIDEKYLPNKAIIKLKITEENYLKLSNLIAKPTK
ncbi:MAG TPA: GTPase HflX [Elusimicrobiales bacterium]|nr:GTPase HflX [Elusimicrobiales bacterium]HOL62159.1 GTPase HflX [Elusimicrobiales bacterium]HPO95528.1 GTPase HflX [Elusimicrobiales bacterium]